MKAKFIKIFCACLVGCGLATTFTACSDEPDSENFYTFTGEMMSDYMRNREQYSEFATIVQRAGLMDLLSAYGKFTCFMPSNEAVDQYLSNKGLQSIDQLTDADCDTIARTHLVNNIYSTFEMSGDVLDTHNMLNRPLTTSVDSVTAEIVIQGIAHVIYELKDDSVENGIVQPIDMVLENSNSFIADRLRDDSKLSIFYDALLKTGVKEQIEPVDDPSYNPKDYEKYRYKSHTWNEVAWVPDTKNYGFTIFAVPDSVLRIKFRDNGISTDNGDLRALYDLACKLYDPVYPADVSAPGHSFENLSDSVNPLRRFIQYHIINRKVDGASDLTARIMNFGVVQNEAFGFDSKLMNPVDWYQTLLPHTMVKVELLTMKVDEDGNDCVGHGVSNERYINRRYGWGYTIEGTHIENIATPEYDALNGHYFYVNDVVAFSQEVRDVVQNDRIRMDFSAIFPEVMTNNMRLKGDPTTDDSADTPDDSSTPKNGRNFYFPLGYLDGVSFTNCYCVMRRPHINFWSWQGDEWNLFGDYDFTFRIPPVPYSGEWQLRLGFCALETRGVMQVYFDGVPQGIPLDMTKYLNSDLYIGDRFDGTNGDGDETLAEYNKKTDEEKAEEQKLLRNLGAYRDGRAQYHFSSSSKNFFLGNPRTYRRILCQTYIDATQDHYLRFRVASDGKQGNNNEFMLDFFEMVPKSVYGVDGEGEMENDL